jgi:hypothetical protein
MRLRHAALIGAALLSGAWSRALAQSDHYAPLVLLLPSSTRALGLGDSYVTGRDADALFYNPAQLGVARGMSGSVERYRSASTLGSLSSAMQFGSGGAGIGVQFLDYGAVTGRYPSQIRDLGTRGPVTASSVAATVGYAMAFKGARLGFAAKYVEERMENARGSVVAGDIGLAKDLDRITIGLAVQNIGDDIALGSRHASLPQRYTLGMSGGGLPAGPFDIGAAASVSVLRNGFVTPAGGVEAGYTWLDGYTITGRFGFRRTETSAQSGATFGATLSIDRFSLDYANEEHAHRFGVRVR